MILEIIWIKIKTNLDYSHFWFIFKGKILSFVVPVLKLTTTFYLRRTESLRGW